MDGDNIHRLRVLSFGNTAGADYFVEQLGDHTEHVKLGQRTQRTPNEAKLCRLEFQKSTKKDQGHHNQVKPSQRVPNNTRTIRQEFPTSTYRDQGDSYPHRQNNNVQTDQEIQRSIRNQIPDQITISNEQHRNYKEVNKEKKDTVPNTGREDPKLGDTTEVSSDKHKSNSGIFRIPSKRKEKTKHTRHKIFLFDDSKRSLSHQSCFKYSDRIKEALFNHNKSLKLKVEKTKRGKEPKYLVERNDNVHVLFLRENESQEKKPITSKKRREDIFGFRKCNRFRPSISVYQQYRSQLLRPKKKTSMVIKPRKSHSTDDCHIPLRVLASRRARSAKSIDSCVCSQFNTVHAVNVVEFPPDSNAFHSRAYLRKKKSQHERKVLPPKVLFSKCCRNDAGVETSQLSYKSIALSPHPSVVQTECAPCTEFQQTTTDEGDGSTTVIIKYILFGLALLVWSPCILMVIICWLITYPLRPNCIRAQARARYGLDKEYSPCGTCVTQRGFWMSFVNWIKSAHWFNRGAYKAVASLVKGPRKNDAELVCGQPLPNPNRRYTLYHSNGRGWVMKAVKFPGGRLRPTEVLNIACDPVCPRKKSKCKRLKEIARKRKTVRIAELPTDIPSNRPDYGTVTPTNVEYHKYKVKRPKKVITSQKDVPRQSRVPTPQPIMESSRKIKSCLPCSNRIPPHPLGPCLPCHKTFQGPQHMQNEMKQSKLMQAKLMRQHKLMQDKLKFYEKNNGCLKYERSPKIKRKFKVKSENVCIRAYKNFRDCINETEKRVWYPELNCNNLWVYTLRNRPCFGLYKMGTSFYATFLGIRNVCLNCCQIVLFCLSTVVWFPALFCFYLCCEVICKMT